MPDIQIPIDPLRAADSVLSAIKEIAGRLADAGIDPLTIDTAQKLSSNFELSSEAKARIYKAIEILQPFASFSNLLWFGFGVEHIVRKLAKTKDGVACLALCGCIVEVFTPETSSVILDELAMLYVESGTQPTQPTQPEWKALVDACQGVLASTDFGRKAEEFMDLNRDTSIPSDEGISDHRFMGGPKDIAEALHAIFPLTKPKSGSITIIGGSTCGWIAAVAHWFMGITVEIWHPSRTSPSVYEGASRESRGRLTVKYLEQNNVYSAHIESKTLVINDVKEIIYSQKCHSDLPAGRLKWDEAIRGTFGRAGKIILEDDATFRLIGSMARVLAGFARAESETQADFETLQNWIGYRDSSYGYGYVSFAKQQFPELEKSDNRNSMRDCAEESYTKALRKVAAARHDLATRCGCELCTKGSEKKTGFCLLVLVEVLTLLIWALSLVKFDVVDEEKKPMNPNRQGLEAFYLYHAQLLGYRWSNDGPPEDPPIRRLFSLMNVPQLFAIAEFVFAGGLSDESPQPGRLASVSGCVCFYLDILCHIPNQLRNAAPLLHILPGGIQLQSGRKCIYIEDGLPRQPSGDAFLFAPKRHVNGDSTNALRNYHPNADVKALEDTAAGSLTPSLVVTETTETMEETGKLRVSVRFDSAQGTYEVGPRRMLDHILRASGTVICPRRPNGCRLPSPTCKGMILVDGKPPLLLSDDVKAGNAVAMRLLYGNSLKRYLGSLVLPIGFPRTSQFVKPTPDPERYAVILREECLPCCIKAAIEARGKGFNVVYKDHSSWEIELLNEQFPAIRETVMKGLSSVSPPASTVESMVEATVEFIIHWELLEFFEAQFDKDQDIGKALVLIGSSVNAQAITCEKYMSEHWPETGADMLDAIKAAMVTPRRETCNHKIPIGINLDIDIVVDRSPVVAKVIATGLERRLVEVAQQLSWLAAAFRWSKLGQIAKSEVQFDYIENSKLPLPKDYHATFSISVLDLKALDEREKSCWHALFYNSVIAVNFPITRRENEVGLEIPVEIMSVLGGVLYPVEYGKGIILKGYSTLFVPIRVFQNSVQWHFHYTQDGTRIPAYKIEDHCQEWAKVQDMSFLRKRAFLGVWKIAEIHLGTEAPIHIKQTQANGVGRTPEFSGGAGGLALGGLIPGAGGLSGIANFVIGANQTNQFIDVMRPFQRILEMTMKHPLLLYDPEEKRGWLVPTLSVMLSMAHADVHFYNRSESIPYAKASWNGGRAAYDVIQEAVAIIDSIPVGERAAVEKAKRFRDLILRIWVILEKAMDSKNKAKPAGLHLSFEDKLSGWEMMDLVTTWPPFRIKQQSIKRSSNGWIELSSDSIILFCRGLGDVIRPASSEDSNVACKKWSLIPKERDFLTASIICLEQVCSRCGSDLREAKLSLKGMRWHRGPMLFEDCQEPEKEHCNCNRLQGLSRKLAKASTDQCEKTGAVVFGKITKLTKSPPVPRHQATISVRETPLNASQSSGNSSSTEPLALSPSLLAN